MLSDPNPAPGGYVLAPVLAPDVDFNAAIGPSLASKTQANLDALAASLQSVDPNFTAKRLLQRMVEYAFATPNEAESM